MAKKKIQVLLDPEVYDLVIALSKATDKPVSPLINSLLVSLAPGLEATLKMAQLAKKMDYETKRGLADRLQGVANEMEKAVSNGLDEAERFFQPTQ